MRSPLVEDAISRVDPVPLKITDCEVDDLSSKIRETFRQFDARVTATERQLRWLRAGGDESAGVEGESSRTGDQGEPTPGDFG